MEGIVPRPPFNTKLASTCGYESMLYLVHLRSICNDRYTVCLRKVWHFSLMNHAVITNFLTSDIKTNQTSVLCIWPSIDGATFTWLHFDS